MLAEWLTVAVTMLGALWVLARWVGRVDANTAATERLTQAFEAFSDDIRRDVADHEARLRVLEDRHRDANGHPQSSEGGR